MLIKVNQGDVVTLFWVHLDQEKPSFAALTAGKRQTQTVHDLSKTQQKIQKSAKRRPLSSSITISLLLAAENILEGLVVAQEIPKKKPSTEQNQPLKSYLAYKVTILLSVRWPAATRSESRDHRSETRRDLAGRAD